MSQQELWELIGDPHHLPRWWPRVSRVEDVEENAFTQVLKTGKGRLVRADFDVVARDEQARTVVWAQRVTGTPFERVLSASETELRLAGAPADATEVTIELRQQMGGFLARFGGFMVRRAAARTLDEALDGLERISG